ncbi:hypothetical protein LINGRAHAP2_LOCUS15835 [Linum grandiflorum]
MGKSLLLLHHHYTYHPTPQFRSSFPVIATRINYSTAASKNNSSDHHSRRMKYQPPKFLNSNNNKKKQQQKKEFAELNTAGGGDVRTPLSEMVADCERQWFEDALREAEAGDIQMQVLVGQMYTSGYGVAKDVSKGRAWIDKASKTQSLDSMLEGDEQRQLGYNTSDDHDSDSQQQEPP